MALNLTLGDCLKNLRDMPSDSVDSLITDPPAGIAFMGKEWDGDKGGRGSWVAWMTEVMQECLRVLKPGAHGLVWALPRTSHWTMTALENAGFEVRDVVTHLFGTGFPKSLDVSKAIDKAVGAEREVVGRSQYADRNPNGHQTGNSMGKLVMSANITAPATPDAERWQGFGTALKPACEFWVLVRKPLGEKTVAANVLRYGTGGLNIDASRISTDGQVVWKTGDSKPTKDSVYIYGKPGAGSDSMMKNKGNREGTSLGRFPANLVLDEEAAQALDEQSGLNCGAAAPVRKKPTPATTKIENIKPHASVGDDGKSFHGDAGGASRFFYVAKASKSDRGADNNHPTVKSTKLMGYLIRLITPPGGTVLDPFMGSGTTGVVAKSGGFGFVGIEQDSDYFGVAMQRMEVK